MNVREYEMYANALPELQKYLSENCKGTLNSHCYRYVRELKIVLYFYKKNA